MPVRDGDLVVGGIAASGAAVSPFYPAGTDPMDMIADGVPANPEDLVVHYALGVPYAGQHGDDGARWRAAFGEWPGDVAGGSPAGQGMTPAPAAQAQPEHQWAVALAGQVMAEARRRGQRVAVAVADHRGDPVQHLWTFRPLVSRVGLGAAGISRQSHIPESVAQSAGRLFQFHIHFSSGREVQAFPEGLRESVGRL